MQKRTYSVEKAAKILGIGRRAAYTMSHLNMDKLNGNVQHKPYPMRCRTLSGRPTMQKRTYSVEEAAKFLGIGRSAAYQAVRTGEIPAIRIGRRLLIPILALEQMLLVEKITTSETQINADPGAKSGPLQ